MVAVDSKNRLEDLTTQRDILLCERELAELQRENEITEQVKRHIGPVFAELQEGWGDVVDRDDMYFDSNRGGRYSPYSLIDDRTDGKLRPLFENEQDLSLIRGIGQYLSIGHPTGTNITEALTNYTIGQGFTYTAEPANDDAKKLAAKVQQVIDVFCNENSWCGDLERELHSRSREDGEFFLSLTPDRWQTRADIIEPANVTEPVSSTRSIERWLQHDGDCSWSFGVHTHRRRPARPLGYHVVYDSSGSEWDYFPADNVQVAMQADSGLMEHFKRGYRNVKRGVSEFFIVKKFLEHAEGLLDNTAHGAKIQAAIAYIVHHAAGVPESAVSRRVAGQADVRTQYNTPNGSKVRNERNIEPGKVIHTGGGATYAPAPMGSSNAPNFIIIEQALLRMAGVRWSMPEYMVSGDASNGNYASTLVAESPFTKSREADQTFYASCFRRVMWKVVKIAHAWGYFDDSHVSFDDLQRLITISVDPPEVASRDKLQTAQAKEILKRNGVISAETWAKEEGYDHQEERDRGARPDAMGGMPATVGVGRDVGSNVDGADSSQGEGLTGGELGGLSRRQFTNNQKAIRGILGEVAAGDISPSLGREELQAVGVAADRAERLVNEVLPTEPEVKESLQDTTVVKALELCESFDQVSTLFEKVGL